MEDKRIHLVMIPANSVVVKVVLCGEGGKAFNSSN